MGSIRKIISGGQTGVDRAALDTAIFLGVPYGGWLPRGRMTESGPLPEKYQMQVLETGGYPERTRKNVEESDGTLILSHGKLTGGSALTQRIANRLDIPCLHIDLDYYAIDNGSWHVQRWLADNAIHILNVAGPRESSDPRVYNKAIILMNNVLVSYGKFHERACL